jgi:hypothetical protein
MKPKLLKLLSIINTITIGSLLGPAPISVSGSMNSSSGTILVTNCTDSGPGSLREAIELANSNAGPDIINFAIPRGVPGYNADEGVWRIFPQSQLPAIGDALTINGFSQREFIGQDCNPFGPEIVINGANAGNYTSGFYVRSSGVNLRGLTINNFYYNGIWLDDVDGGSISGCYIGTDLSGSEAMPNGWGIWIGNKCKHIVVAPMDTSRNVISGNINGGITIADTSKHINIIDNIIGLNRKGNAALGNGNYGGIFIEDQSDSNAVFDNWIGANKYGIYVYKSNFNQIETNCIGNTPVHPDSGLGNEYDGIYIANKSCDNRILDNNIWFNRAAGIRIYGEEPVRNRISHNSISENTYSGILYDSGGANMIAAPVITDLAGSSVSGNAIADVTIEIYTDSENEGALFQGETKSGSNGKFTWTGTIFGPYPNITAIAIDNEGNTSYFSKPMATGIECRKHDNQIEPFALQQNYPNPFNPTTTINYSILKNGHVKLTVYDLLGREVAIVVNETQSAGTYAVFFDASHLANGIYICRLETAERAQSKKLMLLK